MNAISSFNFKTLRQAKNSAEYNLYKAALEWDLIDPILIESKDDLRSEQTWRDLLTPYHHQVNNLITFCRRLPVTLIADEVGLGKTITAGLIISELISRGRISRILVVCPKILMPQWHEELDKKFGIQAQIVIGNELNNIKMTDEKNVIITTYASARLYFDTIANAGFEMLVLDEAHKLRNLYGVPIPPQVAIRFRQALEDRLFKYILMLTATPVQNRLWDIYSLIDLLTVARGHVNPFGTPGMFAKNYIFDNYNQARRLRPEMQDEFRSIVYGYMSRVRRVEVNLLFPERIVKLHKVIPTPEEIELLRKIAEPIQKLHPFAQVSLLQAIVSSPEALARELENMAENGSVSAELAIQVRAIVNKITNCAKLNGLDSLINNLQKEQPDKWRAVIFTGRRETQTKIEIYLQQKGIGCGIINGDSSVRNQETITRFWEEPTKIHVIVSTEAGSEGINLQIANVLVNYDLPWNPMVVEQRIGRMQRLASKHASVCVFNIVLKDTFEEKIVGRLMAKLQMVSHAVGDIEALLPMEDDSESFEEKIRKLAIASLAGKNINQAIIQEEKNILDAKIELENQEKHINELLGGMNEIIDNRPRCPKLDLPHKSMDAKNFAITSLEYFGAKLSQHSSGIFNLEKDGQTNLICFDDIKNNLTKSVVIYKPGSAAFERLVNQITNFGLHKVQDIDQNIESETQKIAENWAKVFEGALTSSSFKHVLRRFSGNVLLRLRITVAYDSYERLVEVGCLPIDADMTFKLNDLEPLESSINDVSTLRLSVNHLTINAMKDKSVSDFCHFYAERLSDEIKSVGENNIMRKKLEDDFTPRIEVSVVGIEGILYREIELSVDYNINSNLSYKSSLTIIPSSGEIINQPKMEICSFSGKIVPSDCLTKCAISNKIVLTELLVKSEVSGRMALPEYTAICSLTGKRVLSDEVEKSAITGKIIASKFLKTSALSGKRAEPEFFGKCEFTSCDVFENELAVSQISGKHYRVDEKEISAVSGKSGHKQEFIYCAITNQSLLNNETERCEVTGKLVMPGLLELCEVSGKKVLPSELMISAVSGKKALKKYFIISSISNAQLLEEEAIRSSTGKFCSPIESRICFWSGQKYHPDDMRICQMSRLQMHFSFIAPGKNYSEVLHDLMIGIRRKSDKYELWNDIASNISKIQNQKHFKVEAAELSLDGKKLAICLQHQSWFGLKIRYEGLFYSLTENTIVGRPVSIKRTKKIRLG